MIRQSIVILALASLGCHDPAAPEKLLRFPSTASAAKPGASNPQLRFTLADEFVPIGEGGSRTAAVTADDTTFYTNNICGVFAVVNLATTDAIMDPDGNYTRSSGCGPRFIRLRLSPTLSVSDGAYITIGGLGAGPASDTGRVGFQLSSAAISATGCSFIRYGYPGDPPGTDAARITLVSTGAKRIWEVESKGGHQPICWRRNGGSYDKNLLAPMPFKFRVEEL